MSISEKLGRAAANLGSAAVEAADIAKAKYEEKVAPEKRAEIKDKLDKGLNTVEKAANVVSEKLEQGYESFKYGYNNEKNQK